MTSREEIRVSLVVAKEEVLGGYEIFHVVNAAMKKWHYSVHSDFRTALYRHACPVLNTRDGDFHEWNAHPKRTLEITLTLLDQLIGDYSD